MEAQHTPGPWSAEAGYGHHGLRLDGPHGEVLGHVRAFVPTGDVAHGMPVMQKWAEGQANAKLIAAAPELLDAVHALLDALPSATTHPAIAQARAAIAKATGEPA